MINPNLEHPKVYNDMKTQNDIEILARLRTGTHQLKIETGRQSGLPREQRLCRCGEIEDEEHFLIRCMNYSDIRRKYKITVSHRISDILSNGSMISYVKELYGKRKQVFI